MIRCSVQSLFVIAAFMIGWGALAMGQEPALSVETVEQQIEALDDPSDLAEEDRERAESLLQEARRELQSVAAQTETVDAYVDAAANSGELISRLRQELEEVQSSSTNIDGLDTSEDLRNRLTVLQSEYSGQTGRRADLLDERADLASRASIIAEDTAEARAALDRLLEAQTTEDDAADSALSQAQRTLLRARIVARRSEISNLQRELSTIPDRQSIVSARIALADAEIAALDARIAAIQQRMSNVRMDRADAALSRALEARTAAESLPPFEQTVAEENVDLANELKSMADVALQIEQETKTRSQQTRLIRQQTETVERILATGRITVEAGALLRRLRESLPRTQQLKEAIDDAVEARAATQLDLILWQDRLRTIQQTDPPLSPAIEFGEESEPDEEGEEAPAILLRDLLDQRRGLLNDLIDAGQAQLDRLTEMEIRVTETLSEAQELRTTLSRRLLWLPSNVRPLSNWPKDIRQSVDFVSSPSLIEQAWSRYVRSVREYPGPVLFALILAIIVLLGRARLQAMLEQFNDAVGKVARDRYYTTPLAISLCLLIALPVPALLAGAAVPGLLSGDTSTLVLGPAAGLLVLAAILLLINFFNVMGQKDGVLATHFNWTDKARRTLRKTPRLLVALFCLCAVLLAGTMASRQIAIQHSIGMPAFVLGSVLVAALGYSIFNVERGVVRRVMSDDLDAGPLFLGLLAFSVAPLAIGLMPLFGYFDTAIALQARVLETAGILVFSALVYGILRRLFLIAQRRLALRKARERREQLAAERAEREEMGEDAPDDDDFAEPRSPIEELELERERISTQTQRFLLYLVGAGGLFGVFIVWATMLPALGVANDITLWTGVDTIDGVRSTRPVTLWNFILFIVFIAAGFIAAYNIRGVLEVGPFQRLKLSPGSRYAITTIFSYLLVGAGIIAGFLQLGVDWSRLQWIIAALGVGLGFGLQEIVANFISGLIILFERPIRVGDTVTIGELQGTVTNIAIRATTIRDFDNLEVLLPNKAIITENVTNWTLRDTVMRIIVPIGVAYGSDIEQVRAILLKIANEENDVLETPEPRVYFMDHGDSSLEFELRVFISSPRRRFRVRDELNTAINRELAAAKIQIPFPQRDIHIKQS